MKELDAVTPCTLALEHSSPSTRPNLGHGLGQSQSQSQGQGQGQLAVLLGLTKPIHAALARQVRDPGVCDDLFQEVWAKALTHRDQVRNPQAFPGWILRIAQTTAQDHLRTKHRQQQRERDPSSPQITLTTDPADPLIHQEAITRITQAIDALPSSQRQVVRMRVDESLTTPDIARRLGISHEAVQVRLCRGRATLAAALGQPAA